jgi:hypothetical protein
VKGGGSSKVVVGKLKEGGNRMKGDVKVIVSGSSGHIVFDEKSLIKRILMYVISAILGFGALFLASLQ